MVFFRLSKILSSFCCYTETPRGQNCTGCGPEAYIIVVRVGAFRHPACDLSGLIQCHLNSRSIRFPGTCAALQAEIFGDDGRLNDPPTIWDCVGLRPNKGGLSI